VALTALPHCKLLGSFQILFSLGVFLIARFFTIFTAFVCVHTGLVQLASPGVAAALLAVPVCLAPSAEAFPGFRWARTCSAEPVTDPCAGVGALPGAAAPCVCPSLPLWGGDVANGEEAFERLIGTIAI